MSQYPTQFFRKQPNEGGFVLVSVAALSVVLIGFLALGVSMGYLYSARTTAQEIGDAAALAGAYTYITTPTTTDAEAEAVAEYNAEQFALDRAAILGVNLDAADVTATADALLRRVEVTIETTQPTFFATVLGINTADVRTESLAEAGTVATGESCPKPFFIPNNALQQTPVPGDYCPGCGSANGDGLIVWDDPSDNGTAADQGFITTAYLDTVLNNTAGLPADPDSFFTLKPTNPGQGGDPIAPGQYYLIDFDNSNDNDLVDDIVGCAPNLATRVECFDNYSVTTGVQNGNIAQGLGLIGNTVGLLEQLPTQPHTYDLAASPLTGRVVLNDGITHTHGSPQLTSAPIWDVCNTALGDFCINGDFPNGTSVSLEIVGFATIFITPQGGRGGGVADVEAYIVGASGCGLDGGGIGPTTTPDGSTVFGLPLRLVNENN